MCSLKLLWLDRFLAEMGEMLLGGGHPLWTCDPDAARGRRIACGVLGFIDLFSGPGAEQLSGGMARQPNL